MSDIKWHVPFSPTIMETTVSTKFLDIVNRVGDEVLNDEEKSNKFDWSNKLVGKVHKEVTIPLEDEDKDYVDNEIKQACISYGMNDFVKKEMEDHYPSSGMIQFMTGEKQTFRKDVMNFVPEVGKFVIFPSWLKHSVFPFYVGGERRSMSFNARYIDYKQQKLLKRN